jgi:Chitin binding Peritrophin-A domain
LESENKLKMVLKIVLLSLALSPLIFSFEIMDFLSTGNYESVVPRGVFRRDPCANQGARQFEPNPRGCSWFWECKDENQTLLTSPREGKCPFGLYFQAYPLACVYPDEMNITCFYDDENAEIAQRDCVEWDPMQLLPHQFMCNKFRVCWEDMTIIKDCPSGYEFSYFDNECVEPFLADCRAVDNYCTNITRRGVRSRRDPYSCIDYHFCNECDGHYSLVDLKCGDGHYYDDTRDHCTVGDQTVCDVSFILFSII